MNSSEYTFKQLKGMVTKTMTCCMCRKEVPIVPGENGIAVAETGARLYITGICPEHGMQTNYFVL